MAGELRQNKDCGTDAASRRSRYARHNVKHVGRCPQEDSMRKARLLSTVAATLLLTVGVASAQTMNKDEAPAPRACRAAEGAGRKGSAGHEARRAESRHAKRRRRRPARRRKRPTPTRRGPPTRATMDKATDKARRPRGSSDANGGADMKSKANEQRSRRCPGRREVEPVRRPKQDAATTGQGAAAGSAKLSTEQRSKITTIFKQHKVEPAHLNVSVTRRNPRAGERALLSAAGGSVS